MGNLGVVFTFILSNLALSVATNILITSPKLQIFKNAGNFL